MRRLTRPHFSRGSLRASRRLSFRRLAGRSLAQTCRLARKFGTAILKCPVQAASPATFPGPRAGKTKCPRHRNPLWRPVSPSCGIWSGVVSEETVPGVIRPCSRYFDRTKDSYEATRTEPVRMPNDRGQRHRHVIGVSLRMVSRFSSVVWFIVPRPGPPETRYRSRQLNFSNCNQFAGCRFQRKSFSANKGPRNRRPQSQPKLKQKITLRN
jgi:hypothetical protein